VKDHLSIADMVQTQSKKDAVATDTAGGGGGISLGKGAWDCDRNVEIPPEAEVRAERGLEMASMSH